MRTCKGEHGNTEVPGEGGGGGAQGAGAEVFLQALLKTMVKHLLIFFSLLSSGRAG